MKEASESGFHFFCLVCASLGAGLWAHSVGAGLFTFWGFLTVAIILDDAASTIAKGRS